MLEKFETVRKDESGSKKHTLKDLREMILIDNIDRDTAIFKRNPSDCMSSKEILDYFTLMVSGHTIGTCCVRESRKIGMISFTIKISDDKVCHHRFAYISGDWKDISTSSIKEINKLFLTTPSFKAMSRSNIGDALDQLFLLLKTNYKLEYRNLLWPDSNHASKNDVYKGYVISEHLLRQTEKTFSNPIKALEKIISMIQKLNNAAVAHDKSEIEKTALEFNSLDRIPKNLSRGDLVGIFKNWLEENKLDEELLCPLSLEFFDNPYRLSSGQVIDKASLILMDPKICPITREDLTDEPVRLMGWKRALNDSLMSFIDLIQLYQNGLLEEIQDDLKNIPAIGNGIPGTFFALSAQSKAEEGCPKDTFSLSRST